MLVLQKRDCPRDHYYFVPQTFPETKSNVSPPSATPIICPAYITIRARETGKSAFYYERKQAKWSTVEYNRLNIWAPDTSQTGRTS